SQAWFVDRLLDPRSIDAEVDAKLKGMVAHTALSRFFSGLPKELGVDRVEPSLVEDAVRFMRVCLDSAIGGVRMEMTGTQRRELRLQIPLYMLVLRDLVGIEPLGGVYRPLSGERKARGLLRAEAKADVLPGYVKTDYVDEDEFWSQVEGAKALATQLAGRIREGDVRHDPKGGECPSWCDLWPICRVGRA